jgi:exodeoxyribonuclease V beta subunit
MQGYHPFDILHSPLEGTNLIEASAGTGKTYTLTALFIRLVVEKGLTVDRILTVTFTEAATNELKQRLRDGLRKALDAFPHDPALDTRRKERARGLLSQALRDFDRAAVFTIHGFCMRVLVEHAFESGAPFDSALVPDVKPLEREVVEDFWRREVAAASPLFAAYAAARGFTPEGFMKLSGRNAGFLEPRIVPRADAPETEHEEGAYRKAFDSAASAWAGSREEVSRILLEDKGLNRTKFNPSRVRALIRAMDIHMVPGRVDPLLFEGFEKFTASFIRKGTKKKHPPPEHDFFHRCESLGKAGEDLHRAFEKRLLGLKVRLFHEVEEGLRRKKSLRNSRSFDDLLREVMEALTGKTGASLAAALRARYGAALIDEFQDTDPLQYGIFKRLFGEERCPLFLIGDPKQAIYGFRGADVFAYMEAAREAGRRYTLPRNYRSEPDLVQAVNALFLGRKNPFALEDIPFHAVEPAGREKPIPPLTMSGGAEPPFRIWLARGDEQEPPGAKIPKGPGRDLIARAVASEVVRLAAAGRSGEARIGGEPLQEGDMAVLLRTNREARVMQRVLARRGVASVLYTTSSLFETEEADETARILGAMARPENGGLLRAALTTVVLGCDAPGLESVFSGDSAREALTARFFAYHETLAQSGFFQAFRELLNRENVLTRLLCLPDGERRATNLLHLSEVLHRAEAERGLGMEGLLKWFLEQRDPATRGTEEEPLRLESDRQVVKLVTIHKSKGLEYPVVFCPFIWKGSKLPDRQGPVTFHDMEEESRLTIDLGTEGEVRERHIDLAEREILSENLRILYVAFTRARNRCYTVWGRFNEAETSAPAYLFHSREGAEPGGDPVRACASGFAELSDSDVRADLEALREASAGAIDIAPLPGDDAVLPPLRPETPPRLRARAFNGEIDRSRGIASFSSLTSSGRHAGETPDRDSRPHVSPPVDTGTADALRDGRKPAGLQAFPGGARSGTCLHSVMESLDFTDPDPSSISAVVRDRLRDHGFDPSLEGAVLRMVEAVLSTPLDPEREGLRLDRISMKDRLTELSFFLPLNRLTPAALAKALIPHTGEFPGGRIPEQIGRLRFAPVRGFMRGFVDLVFRFKNQWFIVDWKSNDLGPAMEDYSPDRMASAMEDGLYTIQYLFYTLALDRYLSFRIKDYDYSSHFGGVYYVFLRGVDPDRGPGSGVFRALPPEALILGLRKALIPAHPA